MTAKIIRGASGWRYIGRYVSGRSLDGRVRTDSRFLHRGTRALTTTGYASTWAMLPGWQRAAWRLGSPVVALGSTVGYALEPLATEAAAGSVAAVGTVVGARRVVRRVKRRGINKRLVYPTYSALRGPLRLPPDKPDRWVTIPTDYRTNPSALVTVRLPDDFLGTDDQRKVIADTVRRRLGGQWDADYRLDEYPLLLTLRQPPQPPAMVAFADSAAILQRREHGKLFLGLGTRGEEVWLDLDAETPHVAMSIGTGGGKSSTLRVLISQLASGEAERVMILDPKKVSQQWAADISGIDIYRDPKEWTQAIAEYRAEMDRRYNELQFNEDAKFPRWVLVIEEMNSMTALLKQWWARERRKEDPKLPPALDDLGFILFMGRQACMNVLAVLQQANAKAMGGSDFRDQFGAKILARFSPQVWNMLVGTYPRPKPSRHPGRALVLIGEDETQTQLAFFTTAEAKAVALNDYSASTPAGTLRDRVRVPNPADQGDSMSRGQRVTLADAARQGIVPANYEALKKAKQRRERNGFPAGQTRDGKTTYTPHELVAWYAQIRQDRAA